MYENKTTEMPSGCLPFFVILILIIYGYFPVHDYGVQIGKEKIIKQLSRDHQLVQEHLHDGQPTKSFLRWYSEADARTEAFE